MGCGCNNGPVQSWLDIQTSMPQNPLDLIAYSTLGGATVGVYANSTNYAAPTGTWVASPFVITGEPSISTNGPDDILTASLAAQWNFDHLTDSLTVAPPLRKVLFLRAGAQWTNAISIDMGGGNYDDIQLSFRDNAGTRGDSAGTVPVISFTNSFTGINNLNVVVRGPGLAVVGLRAHHVGGTDYSMFEMEWHIVP